MFSLMSNRDAMIENSTVNMTLALMRVYNDEENICKSVFLCLSFCPIYSSRNCPIRGRYLFLPLHNISLSLSVTYSLTHTHTRTHAHTHTRTISSLTWVCPLVKNFTLHLSLRVYIIPKSETLGFCLRGYLDVKWKEHYAVVIKNNCVN